MSTLAEKLSQLLTTKQQIRSAIADKGVAVSADTPFRGYADQIRRIKTGGLVTFAAGYTLPVGTTIVNQIYPMTVSVTGKTE